MITEKAAQSGVTWMMNNDMTGDKWMMLPTELRISNEVPLPLRHHGSVWLVTGQPQTPLKSAVKAGVNLTLKYLGLIRDKIGFTLPEKGKGSGKNGNIIKIDWATALVNHLWPDDDESEKKRMIDAITGSAVPKVKCPDNIIAAVKELGQEGERDFKYCHELALNQEFVEKERKLREPTVDREEQKTFTPTSLKSLLPDAPGVACNRNPMLNRYQGFYPGLLSSKRPKQVL